jgi:hypothetical protein
MNIATLIATAVMLGQPPAQGKSPSWHTAKATFYGHPYDDGRKRVCADGKTVYSTYGRFCATGLAPLGSTIELKRNGKTLRLKVADTQAPRYRHQIDLPTGTWKYFGDPPSSGKIKVEWRRIYTKKK